MFDIGFMELVVLAIVAMLVVGPERLPEAARAAGKAVGKFKRFFSTIQKQIDQELRTDELNQLNKKIMDDTNGEIFSMNDGLPTGPVASSQSSTAASKVEPTPPETAPTAAIVTEKDDNRKTD